MNIKVMTRKSPVEQGVQNTRSIRDDLAINIPLYFISAFYLGHPRNREKDSPRERRAFADERLTFASRTTKVSR